MRLTHLKLAGFKSFPEPTHIHIPGQLVGVVGPNGCGKSNIIDAVRWVLGESQAKQLRGETMQDVIFNGTADRHPLGRASVELVFDNSLGRAPGQWSNYAEISVKRVLERNGDSAYYINNSHVRRRDVTDIFMGTGLGPRAYAIIEQGMISRIVESKPEELRVFLEEAAGISRYKERRRETELRLGDARDNLKRVEDIRSELGGQIEHLGAQAEQAKQYIALQTELRTTQNLLWLIKKRDAGNLRERALRDLEKINNEIEAETANLRGAETRLEETRQGHYTASDAVHAAQGLLYETNAEVARLENQLQYLRDSRKRLEQQLAQVSEQLQTLETERETAAKDTIHWQGQLTQGGERLSMRDQDAERELAALPQAEQHHRAATETLTEIKAKLAQSDQAKSLAETHRVHSQRILQQLQTRRENLSEEQRGLLMPDAAVLTQLVATVAAVSQELSGLQQSLAGQQALTPHSEQALLQASQDAEDSQGAVTRIEAQVQALEKLQVQQHRDEKVQQFLSAHGLQGQAKLWQSVQVEPGWEAALESVMGMRLNGIRVSDMDGASRLDPPPPPGVTLFAAETDVIAAAPAIVPWTPLAQRIVRAEPEVAGVLADCLDQVYVVDSWQDALALRHRLPAGAVFASREGHLISRHSVSFFAPQAEMHGLIARAREIVGLKLELSKLQQTLAEKREALAAAEHEHRENREQISMLQSQLSERQATQHGNELERLRLSQQSEQVSHRRDQIERELGEISVQTDQETVARDESVRELEQHEGQLAAHRSSLEGCEAALRAAATELNERRAAAQAAERAVQEARFFERSCREKLQALVTSAQTLARRIEELSQSRKSIETDIAGLVEESLLTTLQGVLGLRTSRENELSARRESLEAITQSLTGIDQERLTAEQKISPLKDKINDLRLKEQEARLSEENAAEQLLANGGVEAELLPLVEKGMRSNALSGEITRINGEIEALGAVNLAALSELETARQRKDHLDSQSQDLNEAVETLESAIHRIDRETRERLQGTFDQVNQNFSTLFPSLFGGGMARIELTGVEILDAGLTVIAQPPGKKTSSIHLLSGGEKALTAVALVFALFRLNPAPFCLLDEVDAPLDDSNTERFCELVKKMSEDTQFLFISHNKITMEMANQLIGITMQESGVSRVVDVDIEQAMRITEEAAA